MNEEEAREKRKRGRILKHYCDNPGHDLFLEEITRRIGVATEIALNPKKPDPDRLAQAHIISALQSVSSWAESEAKACSRAADSYYDIHVNSLA